ANLKGSFYGGPRSDEVPQLIQRIAEVIVGLGVVRLEFECSMKRNCSLLHQSAPPQKKPQLELGRRVRGVEAKDPAEISIGFAIALQATENGTSKHQKLGLFGRSP